MWNRIFIVLNNYDFKRIDRRVFKLERAFGDEGDDDDGEEEG